MPAPSTQPNMGVILEKLDHVRSDVVDIKSILTNHVDAQAKFDQDTLAIRAVSKEQMGVAQLQIIDHEARLKSLEAIMRRLLYTDAIVKWVAVAFMTSIVALIVGILTHQIILEFP